MARRDPYPDLRQIMEAVQPDSSRPVVGYRIVKRAGGWMRQRSYQFQDDFVASGGVANPPWVISASGAGAGINGLMPVQFDGSVGVLEIATGTTNAGDLRCVLGTGFLGWFGDGNAWRCSALVRVPTLSTAGDEFSFTFGLSDHYYSGGATEAVNNGRYFRYKRTVAGNVWDCVCKSGGVLVNSPSTVQPSNGRTFNHLAMHVSEDGTATHYFIDGIQVAGIYDQAVTPVMFGFNVTKSAGLNNRTVDLDFAELLVQWKEPR